jgi:hypothetical protein
MGASKWIAVGVVVVIVGLGGLLAWNQKQQSDRMRRVAYLSAQQETVARKQIVDALPVIDLADWCGRSPAAIAKRFFNNAANVSDCCGNTLWGDAVVKNWRGWKQVSLSFAVSGLRDVTFEPPCNLTEADFIRIAKEKFGLVAPEARYEASDEFHGFTGMDGKVRSVEFINRSARRGSGANMVLLASSQRKVAFEPGVMLVNFNWYVDGAGDQKTYSPPTPWAE